MQTKTRFAVIGAGHGGKAMAAHLSLMGFPVSLYNRTLENIAVIIKRGGIELTSYEGGPSGFAKIEKATSNIEEACDGAEIIMVVVPSTAHKDIASAVAEHLKPGQIIVLNPGRTGGALEFFQVLNKYKTAQDVIVAEAETLIYASRSDGPAQARIFRVKESVPLAALPATCTQRVLDKIEPAFPQFIDGISVLHTGLNNMGAIFHPALTLLNAGRIENTLGEFQFYIEGVTQSVARVLEALDRERVTVAAALGFRARTAMEWLKMAYDATGSDLLEAIHNQTGYYGIPAPATLNHRYITEDIPMSLVPIASIGEYVGVSVPAIDSIIHLACIVHHTDYYKRGRTVENLGLGRMSIQEFMQFVMIGERW
jgi:opine dehydrogenase